jgi:hypothetical protein
LPRTQVELWPDASHAIDGEYADEITQVATAFWQKVDGHRCFCSLPDKPGHMVVHPASRAVD